MTQLAEAHKADGLMVLAVNAWDEPRDQVDKFVKENNLRHKILMNGGELYKEVFGKPGIPTVFLIDRKGNVADVVMGGHEELAKSTKKLLAQKG